MLTAAGWHQRWGLDSLVALHGHVRRQHSYPVHPVLEAQEGASLHEQGKQECSCHRQENQLFACSALVKVERECQRNAAVIAPPMQGVCTEG
jgi:hypothetical protein